MDRCLLLVFSAQFLVNSFLETWGIWPSWKQFIEMVLANKNNMLAGDFGFVGNKIAFTTGKLTKIESYFIIYKTNEKTSYLNTKLKKQLTWAFLKAIINVKFPMKWKTLYRQWRRTVFFVAGWCDGSYKKCCPGATGKRVGCGGCFT